MDLFEYYYPKISEDNLLESKEDFISLEEFCYKFEKDARRYKKFLGNDSRVVLI